MHYIAIQTFNKNSRMNIKRHNNYIYLSSYNTNTHIYANTHTNKWREKHIFIHVISFPAEEKSKECLPTPPEPPTTRTSLEDEDESVLESWVGSEFEDWMSCSLTALRAGDPLLEIEMVLEEETTEQKVDSGRVKHGIRWWGLGNTSTGTGKSGSGVKESLEAMKMSQQQTEAEWQRLCGAGYVWRGGKPKW